MRVPTALVALAMAGCAQLPVEPETSGFAVAGKLSVVEHGQAYSARFRWRQASERYDIVLWGPLGQGGTRLRGDAHHLEIVGRNGKPILAGNPESVMRQRLGWALPLAVLPWWLSGRPAPDAAVQDAQTDRDGRFTAFHQLGWQVRYDRFETTGTPPPPSRITAERPGYRIRIAISTR